MEEDIRKTWFENLSKDDAIKANDCLCVIFEGGAIAGGMSFSELIQVQDARKKFREITGLKAGDVLDSFVDYGYCYGNEFIPESYFGE